MSPEELAGDVRARLAAAAAPQFRAGIQKFFREPVDSYGVRGPAVKQIARAAWRELRDWPPARLNRFVDALWRSGRFEESAVAIYVYRRFSKQCAGREFRLFERWVDRYVRHWGDCDGVSAWLLAAAIGNEPALIGRLPRWTRSRNRWKRRAAAVSLIQEAKRGRNTAKVLRIAGLLLGDGDDMVQKGVGWLLKETYPRKPRQVVGFLAARAARAPRLVLRIAAEKMTPRDRAMVLGR